MLQSGKGRARQMNLGAQHAACEHLIFMHADSRCCYDAVNVVRCGYTCCLIQLAAATATTWTSRVFMPLPQLSMRVPGV